MDADLHRFSVDCPSRLLFEQIADKWSMMVLTTLDPGPQRFNAIRRRLEGVTQKALTQCLRRLERNGLVSRRVLPASPVAVEYAITPLGRTLQTPFKALYGWTLDKYDEVEAARRAYDECGTAASSARPEPAADMGNRRGQVGAATRTGAVGGASDAVLACSK